MKTGVWAVILVMAAALPSRGADLFGDRLRVNGFASQAFLKSDGNNYLVEGTRDGSFQLTEFGLTINSKLSDKVRVGGQLLSRDFGFEGNHQVKLDWGFGEYRAHEALGLRLGKVKLPIGLYNEERDLDFLRPMAFLPQSVYDELARDFLTAGVGGAVFGNVSLGRAGDLDYVGFVGEIDVSDEITFIRVLKGSISGAAEKSFGKPVTGYDWKSDTIWATRVVYNTPLAGLRFGASYVDVSGHFEVDANGQRFSDLLAGSGIPGVVQGGFRDNWVFSGEYLSERFDLRGELRRFDTESGTFQAPTSAPSQAWYLMGTLRVPGADKVAVTAVYDTFTRNTEREHQPERGRHNDKQDFGVGVRWDAAPGFAVKAEYHDVKGAASVFDTWSELNTQDGLVNDWSYFMLKASFAF